MESPASGKVMLEQTLQRVFGFDRFRPGQREAIEALFDRKRVLCIQPTGHGKSLLYQLPSVLLPGITLVISPLLSLMRDQIEQLKTRFGIAAGAINSEQNEAERDEVTNAAVKKTLKILFVSPEQADHAANRDLFSALDVSLLVIDEAHCVSTWGHDFRPAYRAIAKLVRSFEKRPLLLAITATANQRVADDICAQLGGDVVTLRQSSLRDNLRLGVVQTPSYAEKLAYVEAFVKSAKGSSLIYCATRDHVESVTAYLNARGVKTAGYHAGFEPSERKALERGFVGNGFERIVATNALGMGIDKPDLRAVLHFDLPGSITAYYQEMGRAGRDGLPSTCVLLFDANDARVQEHFIQTAQPDRAAFDAVMRALNDGPQMRLTELKIATGLHSTLLNVVLAELIEQGYVDKIEHEKRQAYRSLGRSLEALDLSRYERQGATRQRELSAMLSYGRQTSGCYMVTLCSALGDDALPPCGKCAACKQQPSRLVPDVVSARAWLDRRTAVIPAGARSGHLPGIAVIDGGDFSSEATDVLASRDGLSQPELRARLDYALDALQKVDAVVMVPSQRWSKRVEHGEYIAKRLGVPLLADSVSWKEVPAVAQGELQNDEQRRSNVASKMSATAVTAARILLVDDCVGSLATMREAVRALRAATKQDLTITPFALVKTRW